jgi:hypothetical protein
MQKIILTLLAILLLSQAACTLPETAAALPGSTAVASGQVPGTTDTTKIEQIPPTAAKKTIGESKPTKQVQTTAIPKPKSKNELSAPTSTSPDFIAAEILGRPENSSITVNVVPAKPMEIYYEYGTVSGVFTGQTSPQTAAANVPLETLIDGLQPNTRYYYRLRYGGVAVLERTFVTQRAPGSTFTFAIQGDSHPERVGKQFNADLYTRTLQSVAGDQPDFFMTIGDDFSVDQQQVVNAESVKSLYINQRQWLGSVGSPVFLVNGNHEQAALANLDGTPNNVAVLAQTARNAYFPQPAPDSFYTGDVEPVEFIGQLQDYYAFTWGDALFVVIDPYWHSPQTVDNQFGAGNDGKGKRDLWNVTLGEAQYQWFKQTLETGTARIKFVFAHHVNGTGRGGIELANTYEWGDAANLAFYRPGWDKTIHQLMVDNGVTIFFQGHDHLFARQELDGVIYQSLPSPADPNYAFDNAQAYQSGDKLPSSGYVRVSVSPEGLTVDYIRSYLDKPEELAFTYTVK